MGYSRYDLYNDIVSESLEEFILKFMDHPDEDAKRGLLISMIKAYDSEEFYYSTLRDLAREDYEADTTLIVKKWGQTVVSGEVPPGVEIIFKSEVDKI